MMKAIKTPSAMKAMKVKVMKSMKAMKVTKSMKVMKSMKAMKVTKSMKVMKSMKALKSMKSMKSSGKFSQFINKEKSQWGKTYIIDGVKYDKPIIDAAEIAVKGDGRISVEDS